MKQEKAKGLTRGNGPLIRTRKAGKTLADAGPESKLGDRRANASALSSFSVEQILRSRAENPSDLVVMLDNSGQVLFTNRSLTNPGTEQMPGKLGDLVRPEYRKHIENCLRGVILNAEPARCELELCDGGSTPRLYEALASPVVQEGEVVAVVLHATDLAVPQTREPRSLQSLKMESLGKLAAGLAHDNINLLTIVSIYSDLLADHVDTSDPVCREALQQLGNAVERGASLGKQLLAFSRKEPAAAVSLDLNKLVKEIEIALKRLIGPRIELRVALDRSLWRVMADPSQLQQAIVTLVTNACDAMPDGGEIVIETRNLDIGADSSSELHLPPGPYVMLTVADTGSGMDERTQSSVFEPFFTTKGCGRGTGLGLFRVYGTVRRGGGRIRVESVPGEGTKFKVYLPRG